MATREFDALRRKFRALRRRLKRTNDGVKKDDLLRAMMEVCREADSAIPDRPFHLPAIHWHKDAGLQQISLRPRPTRINRR